MLMNTTSFQKFFTVMLVVLVILSVPLYGCSVIGGQIREDDQGEQKAPDPTTPGKEHDEDDSERTSFFIGTTCRPSPAMKISIRPSYSVSREDLQYVSQEDFQDGKRYLFARINQKTLAMTLRMAFLQMKI